MSTVVYEFVHLAIYIYIAIPYRQVPREDQTVPTT